MTLRRVTEIVAMLALAVWLGGLLALGAIVAPVIFSRVSMPWSADAMTVVFQRFDLVAMSCAATLLVTEAARAVAHVPFSRTDHLRAGISLLAAIEAVYEGASISPRIASLHAAGVVRGLGSAGVELSSLHDRAELLGKTEVLLLVVVVVLHVLTAARTPRDREGAPAA
jgi:putative copper export protein